MDEISDIDFKGSANNLQEKLVEEDASAGNMWDTAKIIFKKRLFLLTMLTLCSLYFIITALQYWISDYMITVLKVSKAKVFVFFIIISTTAPMAGLLIGGKFSEYLGGYTGPYALTFSLISSLIATLCSLPIPFLDNYKITLVLFWLELFFGAAMQPTLIGLMISSVPQKVRSLGNAVAQFSFNLLGYLPSPILYGWVTSLDPHKPSRWGMILTSFWSLWGLIFLFYAFFKQKQK